MWNLAVDGDRKGDRAEILAENLETFLGFGRSCSFWGREKERNGGEEQKPILKERW